MGANRLDYGDGAARAAGLRRSVPAMPQLPAFRSSR